MNKYKIISKDRMYNEVEYYHMKTMTITKNKALYDNINPIINSIGSKVHCPAINKPAPM